MTTKSSVLRVVIARTNLPMRLEDGSEGFLTAAALRLMAVREGWKIEPVPGVAGHIQAIVELHTSVTIANANDMRFGILTGVS